MLYQICHGAVSFADEEILHDINFEIRNTEKIAVVGRNGCGKTTLLKLIHGDVELDKRDSDEDIFIAKAGNPQIGYLKQIAFEDPSVTLEQEVRKVFAPMERRKKELEAAAQALETDYSEEAVTRYTAMEEKFKEDGGYYFEKEYDVIIRKFGFSEEERKKPLSEFSGGQQTKIAFIKLLLSKPDVLFLDEPTNHLDIDTIEWLEGYVKRYPKAVVLVSHDRMFLDDVVDVVYEIEYGVMRRYPGNYSNYVNVKKSDLEQQKSAYIRQQKEIQRMEELIEKFRYKKNKAAFAQSKIKYLDRMERIEDPKSNEKSFNARFVPNVKGGKRVLEVQDLTIGYDQPLCTVNLEVMQSAKIAVIGPNGKGKSTFMKTLMKQVEPLSGSFLLGHQIEVGYFDQELAQFNSANTVLEEVWNDFPDLNRTEVRTALGCFLFTGEEVFKTVDCLSGGEKVRLSFVKLMLSHPNFLLMDEPTNHLDLIGKEALEESLKDYEGTMLFVSHDRYFISKLATAILVIDDGKASYYPLTYEEYMNRDKAQPVEKKQQPEKKESAKPERYINYGKEISKLEKKIAVKEEELEALRELRFEPEYYHDYHKMQELDEKIDLIHNEIENLMQKWEEYSEKVEN